MNLREFFDRYGVSLGVLAVLGLLIALVPGNAKSDRVGTTGGQSTTRAAGSAPGTDGTGTATGAGGVGGAGAGGGAGGGTAAGGGSVAGAQANAGSEVVFGQGPNCRSDGRQVGVSFYMPPCVQWSGGNNGGSTFDGVTSNQIKIIRYNAQIDPATQAILEANKLGDSQATIEEDYRALFNYSNYHYETYGREVVFEDFNASGPPTNDEAARADAQAIADQHPFAVMDGQPSGPAPNSFVREVNARGVLCLCTTSQSHQFYTDFSNVISTGLPTATEYCQWAAEYVGKRLVGNGRTAKFAGDPLMQNKPRVLGLMYLDGANGVIDPDAENIHQDCHNAFAQYGVPFAKEIQFNYNPGRNQDEITNMIGQLKGAGVTTVVPITDPLSPILFTHEATNQNYFPEWFVTGTGLSDTTTAGRLYDQAQWTHAFGMTPLWVTWTTRTNGAGYKEFHAARRDAADGSEGVLIEIYRARVQTLFRGIHMAGPNLNQDTFKQGLFSYPATPAGGGTAARPYVYYSPDSPTDIKDFAEVYYDVTQRGPDERSEQGTGMMMKTDNGQRYQLGQWPTDDPHVFQHKSSDIAISDDPPGGADPPWTPGPAYPQNGCLDCSG